MILRVVLLLPLSSVHRVTFRCIYLYRICTHEESHDQDQSLQSFDLEGDGMIAVASRDFEGRTSASLFALLEKFEQLSLCTTIASVVLSPDGRSAKGRYAWKDSLSEAV